jgi:tetratricopeptide (TPR) repeat protein
MSKVRLILLGCSLLFLYLAGCRSAHTTSAILYIEEQQYEKAVQVLHEGFQYSENEPDAYYYLGEAHSKIAEQAVQENDYIKARENYELAYRYYNRAKEIDPANWAEEVELALQHNFTMRSNDAKYEYQAHYYEQAEGFFRLAYAALPDSLSSIKNIAIMKMQQANEARQQAETPEAGRRAAQPLLTEALDLIDQVLAANQDAYELQANKASILASLGRTQEANTLYDELLRDHGDDANLLVDIANLAIDQRNYERAADLFVQIVDLYENDNDPGNDTDIPRMLSDAGRWLADKSVRRYSEAVELLDRAADRETFPKLETFLYRLQTRQQYGKYLKDQVATETDPVRKAELETQAREQFTRGVEIGNALVNYGFPESDQTRDNLANAHLFLGMCQYELGDQAASDLNMKRYRELMGLE